MRWGRALDIGIWVVNLGMIGFFLVYGYLLFIERIIPSSPMSLTVAQSIGLSMMLLALILTKVLVFPTFKKRRESDAG